MRILMVGALSLPYIQDNWVLPIKELYEVDFVDVTLLLSGGISKQYHEQYLYSLIRAASYDYLFFYPDAVKADFSEDFFAVVRQAGIRVVTFHADDEPEVWFAKNLPYDHRYDLVGTHSLRGLQRRQQMGVGENFIYLPWGFNPSIFDRKPNQDKLYDVVCFGAIKDNAALYTQESDWRRDLLVNVYEFCQQKGLSFKLFGDGWQRHPILSACAGGFVSNEEMVKIYNQSKIVFNPGFSADQENFTYQTKLRHFEVPGCGAFQLTNYNEELAQLFVEDESIVFFKDMSELKEKLLYYVQHDAARERVANHGYITAHQSHTMQKRLTTLFEQAQKMYPISQKKEAPPRRASVKTLRYDTRQEALAALEGFSSGMMLKEQCDFVHIISGKLTVNNIEYSTLNLPVFRRPVSVVGIRTYLQLAAVYDDPMQRKRQNMIGLILPERLNWQTYQSWLLDYIRSNIPSIEDHSDLIILSNYLISSKDLPVIAKLFLSNDVAGFSQLPQYQSGLVVNDFIMPAGLCPAEFKRMAPHVFKLRALLDNLNCVEQRIVLYGGKGTIATDVFSVLKDYPDSEVIGVVDRGLVEQGEAAVNQLPVYSYDDLEYLKPTMIIITAEYSGPAIYESLKHLNGSVAIIPLYDLCHPIWNLMTLSVIC